MQQLLDLGPDRVPIELRFAAECLVDGLHVVEQMRAGVEEARLVFDRHLVAQAQRPLDRDAGVAEVGVVEDLGASRRRRTAVEPDDLGDLVGSSTVVAVRLLAELAALVALAAAASESRCRAHRGAGSCPCAASPCGW